ncbi:MAG TPA: DUF4388 domain-containing protein [Chloroflexota bacterium]|nr:DUF4388 domain-containing protein [Chloroflexota bacterium]
MGPSLTGPPAGPPPSLQGVLDSVRLPAIVGLLVGRRLSGRLAVADGQRGGAVLLEDGHLVAAVCGPAAGRDALVLQALSSPQGRFTFTPGHFATPAEAGPGLDTHTDARLSSLDLLTEVDRRRESLGPLLTAGWEPTPTGPAAGGTPPVDVLQLDRAALAALMAIHRGSREPLAIGDAAGIPDLLRTAAALEHLQGLRLARPIARRAVARPSGNPPRTPTPPATPPGPGRFVPSTVWQVVPAGTAVPPGGEYRLELGGLVYARWPASALSALSALSAVPPPGPPDAAPAPQTPAQDSGPPVPS